MANYTNQSSGGVGQTVARSRRVMTTSRVMRGALVWLAVSLGAWLVLCWLDNLLRLPSGLRLALTVGAVAVMLSLLWKNIIAVLLKAQSLAAAALLLEARYAVPENMLINALCFERRRFRSHEKPFAAQTVKTAASMMGRADLSELWQRRAIAKRAAVAALILLLWLLYGLSYGRHMENALARYVRPLADTPPAGSVVLEVTPDRDVAISEGDDLEVSVRIRGAARDEALRSYPQLVWSAGAESIDPERNTSNAKTVVLRPAEDDPGRFTYTFAGVERSFAFRVFAENTYSRSTQVTVNRVPRIAESQYHIVPPAYTGLVPTKSLGPPEPLAGLPDSKVTIEVRLDKRAESLTWNALGQRVEFANIEGLWRAQTQLRQAGTYQIDVKAPRVAKPVAIASGQILLQADSAPNVEFVDNPGQLAVYPGKRLSLDVRARDDFGIEQVYVTLKETRSEGKPETVESWSYEGPPGRQGAVVRTLLVGIEGPRFRPGGTYTLLAHCKDFSPTEQVGTSRPLIVQVRPEDELTLAADDPAAAAFAALDKAIAAQRTALGMTNNLTANLDDVLDRKAGSATNAKSLRRHRDELSKRQEPVGTYMTEAWDAAAEPRPQFVHRLIELRDNEHKRALERIETLGGLPKEEPETGELLDRPVVMRDLASVERLQEYLLEQLIALKGIVAEASQKQAEREAAEILGDPEVTFDVGVEGAAETFTKELDSFVREQKKIMHERQMLMDRAPEDFTEEQIESLEELALDQSKLSRILSNAVHDFTNLDLQDFGDNALAEQMTSIFEEADELAAKAEQASQMRQVREDAYRLETEAVEMAEELMINCEATLGAGDSIQFMAEVAEDEQLVAPLAELPWELEDLIGDLITSEEQMQPEVEDVGSYLNSLDHTAGPVADGTISSTSAKGKTGDQKPEDNVIQGRSGAGRSGMSDGQLVEPVAKALEDNEYGLRERTSNTPLEDGQVEDQDTKAQTGGTGLGKTTDAESLFGLGGSLPPKVLDMMRDTASRQLDIRQSAQELTLRLEQYNLPTGDLSRSIEAMKQIEQIAQGRSGLDICQAYDDAVNSLKKTHSAVGRQIMLQVTSDAALAKSLDDMRSAGRQRRFMGYEQMIRAYFEALARYGQEEGGPARSGGEPQENR